MKLSQIDLQTLGVAHHVGRELGGEFAAVGIAPEKLRRFAAVCQPHKAVIDLRGDLYILKILARAGDEEVLTLQRRAGKARGDFTQNGAILKVDSLPVGKKAVFTGEEIRLARNAVNQLRNKKIKQGQYTDATDDMLLKLF